MSGPKKGGCNNCGPYGNQIVIKIIKNMSLWIIKNSNILHIIIRIIYKKIYGILKGILNPYIFPFILYGAFVPKIFKTLF